MWGGWCSWTDRIEGDRDIESYKETERQIQRQRERQRERQRKRQRETERERVRERERERERERQRQRDTYNLSHFAVDHTICRKPVFCTLILMNMQYYVKFTIFSSTLF